MLVATTPRLLTATEKATGILWKHLTQAGPQKALPLTYGTICEEIGMRSIIPVHMGEVLDPLHAMCEQNGLPDLAGYAVSSVTGRPGDRYALNDTWNLESKLVRDFDWKKLKGEALYVTVRVRLF